MFIILGTNNIHTLYGKQAIVWIQLDMHQCKHNIYGVKMYASLCPDTWNCVVLTCNCPNSKVHMANMGSIWGRQDRGGSLVGSMNFAIWVPAKLRLIIVSREMVRECFIRVKIWTPMPYVRYGMDPLVAGTGIPMAIVVNTMRPADINCHCFDYMG